MFKRLFSKKVPKIFGRPSDFYKQKTRRNGKIIFGGLFLVTGLQVYTGILRKKLEFYFKDNEWNREVLEKCRSLRTGEYKSTFYLPNAFLQIIYGAKLDEIPFVPIEREEFRFRDGGTGCLDWGPIHHKYSNTDDLPIVLILPGITGSINSAYIRHCILDLYKYGFRTVVYTNRGLEDTPLTTPTYHGAHSISDIRESLDHLQQKHPNSKIYGVGISMGANFMTNLCGRMNQDHIVKGMVSISNPYDLLKTTEHLYNHHNPIWGQFMASNLVKHFRNNIDMISNNQNYKYINLEQGLKSRQPKDYDYNISIRLFGFESTDQYYKQTSCLDWIDNIDIPALFINSKDDPICHHSWIPYDKFKQKDNLLLVLTQKGGHIDYFTTRFAKRWVYNPTAQYLQLVHNRQSQ